MARYKIEEITNKHEWERRVLSYPEANFLQSWNWGLFQSNLGKRIWRLGVWDDKGLAGSALVVRESARRGNYLTIAGGPLIDWDNSELVKALTEFLDKLACDNRCWFVRIRPQKGDSDTMREMLRQNGFRLAPMHLTADLTLRIDVSQSDDELLRQMRKNTRNAIRRANKTLRVEMSRDVSEIRGFYERQLALAHRHKFVPFSYNFLKEQFKAFIKDDQVALFHSYLDEELLASAFVIFYNHEAVYHYGVSTEANAKLPGSYAVLWEAMHEARRRSKKWLNFWGVAPQGELNHRFSGVSLFKRGFGGEEIQHTPSHDLPISKLYMLTRLFEWGRRKARKL